ncbi:MAG: hypothetical protein CR994_00920 [Maribacter sp.]|nr:MAG: hypothetical protein CR994_00920 [Maribacter sp.]
MKKYVIVFIALFMVSGCEDVVEIDVPKDSTRLSIDALVRIDTSEPTTHIAVKAMGTTGFFEEIEPAVLDRIQLLDTSTNTMKDLVEDPSGSGIYVADWSTSGLVQGDFQLNILYNNEQYEAMATFVPTVPFDVLEQGDDTLFSEGETEIVLSYTDEADNEDYYLFDFGFNLYLVSEDTFYPGESFEFSYFYEDGLETGRELNISILGIDKGFYDYMGQLIAQSGGDQGPFQTPTATVRGNIINTTDPDNLAFGYFALCQEYKGTVVIE